ncbi:thiol-disulfide oxidoreductase DCC family protein [Sapientia aquatica]|uniref:DUF393 domain-containing protein n=1 Tax=Sapientia aquatica TaxID=1549640 RepID=A0A4R5W0E3_9BURK|nr:DUF393 domain-containing protein [Sapientia aquatica]TDK64423.1 DUF393 domain-containing protein [Sapientia aquatica]
MASANTTSTPQKNCTVYFDGACPLCTKEIATYKTWQGAEQIEWVDASSCPEQELGVELDRSSALARMHVRDAEGNLIQGAAAFVELWAHLPAMAWLTPVLSNSFMIKILDVMYALFLRIRPLWRKA